MTLRKLLIAMTATLALSACGNNENNENNGEGDKGYASIEETVSAIQTAQVNVWCEGAFTCPETSGSDSTRIARRFESVEQCREVLSELFDLDSFSDAVKDGRASFNKEVADKCVSKLLTSYEQSKCTANSKGLDGDECDDLSPVIGLVEKDGACIESFECKDNLSCKNTTEGDQCARTCVEDLCGTAQCTGDQYCDDYTDSTTPVCVEPAKVGESCETSQCADNASCDNETRLCVAEYSVAENGACTYDSLCQEGLECREQKCIKPTKENALFVGNGEVCTVGNSGHNCQVAHSCFDVDDTTQEGTCKPLSKSGEACNGTEQCVFGLRCDGESSTCGDLLPIGGDCQSSNDCKSSSCDFQTQKCVAEEAECSL